MFYSDRSFCQRSVPWLEKNLHSSRTMLQLTDCVIQWVFVSTCTSLHPTMVMATQQPTNLIVYRVWCVLHRWVYCTRINSVDHVKQHLVEEWHRSDHRIIECAVRLWCVDCMHMFVIMTVCLTTCCSPVNNFSHIGNFSFMVGLHICCKCLNLKNYKKKTVKICITYDN